MSGIATCVQNNSRFNIPWGYYLEIPKKRKISSCRYSEELFICTRPRISQKRMLDKCLAGSEWNVKSSAIAGSQLLFPFLDAAVCFAVHFWSMPAVRVGYLWLKHSHHGRRRNLEQGKVDNIAEPNETKITLTMLTRDSERLSSTIAENV